MSQLHGQAMVEVSLAEISHVYTGPFAGATTIEFLTLGFVALSSLAALIAVTASLREARNSARAQRGETFLTLSERYARPDVHIAVTRLLAWRDTAPESFVERFKAGMQAGSEKTLEVDQARRLLTTYFYDVLKLFELKILDRRLARHLIGSFGARVYVHICLPMGEPFYAQKAEILRRFQKIDATFGAAPP